MTEVRKAVVGPRVTKVMQKEKLSEYCPLPYQTGILKLIKVMDTRHPVLGPTDWNESPSQTSN